MNLVDVIIPAREESLLTLIPTIRCFRASHNCGKIIVVDDGLGAEVHAMVDLLADHLPDGPQLGKGQAAMVGVALATTDRIVFCDGDLTGFTPEHAGILLAEANNDVTLGVPDMVTGAVPWTVDPEVWTRVTGQRSLPRELVTDRYLHGYAMEVQINGLALQAGLRLNPVRLTGCQGLSRWSSRRDAEMLRDYHWLRVNGVA